MFDADSRAFGAFRVSGPDTPGRFGPMFPASDADGSPVVIRTFSDVLTNEQAQALAVLLSALCDAPLDHPGIVKPLAAGVQDGTPFIVHEWVAGEPLDVALGPGGEVRLDDLLAPMTRVAAALDFAAAAGVFHGGLTAGDIILRDEDAAVVGLGLMQALAKVGVEVDISNDAESLARIVYAALGEHPLRLKVPSSALGLIDQLQQGRQKEVPIERGQSMDPDPPKVLALRDDFPPETAAPRVLPEPRFDGTPHRERRWVPLAVAAAVAAVVGFAAGYAVRGMTDAVGASSPAAAATSGVAGALPPVGRSPVESSDVLEPRNEAATTQPPPTSREEQVGGQSPGGAAPEAQDGAGNRSLRTAEPARAASLQVLSRPSGARVFVDGQLAGTTPLVLSNLAPGRHAVRLDLLGYRQWRTEVDVEPGTQSRVAGSLER